MEGFVVWSLNLIWTWRNRHSTRYDYKYLHVYEICARFFDFRFRYKTHANMGRVPMLPYCDGAGNKYTYIVVFSQLLNNQPLLLLLLLQLQFRYSPSTPSKQTRKGMSNYITRVCPNDTPAIAYYILTIYPWHELSYILIGCNLENNIVYVSLNNGYFNAKFYGTLILSYIVCTVVLLLF